MFANTPELGMELVSFTGDLETDELGKAGILVLIEKETRRVEIIQATQLRGRIYRLLKGEGLPKAVTAHYPDNPLDHLEIHYIATSARKRLLENATIGRWIDRQGEIKRAQKIVDSLRRLGEDYEQQLLDELGLEQLTIIKEVSKRSIDHAE